MDLATIVILLVLPALVVLAAWCASMETALYSLSYQDRLRLRKLNPAAAKAVHELLARPRATLVSLLFVNMISTTLFMVLTAVLEESVTSKLWSVILVAFNVVVMTVAGEVISKVLAARQRVKFCAWFAQSVLTVVRAMGPLRSVLDGILITPLVRVVCGVEATNGGSGSGRSDTRLSEDELAALLVHGRDEGAIDEGEVSVLRQVIGLGSVRVREVMVPRVDVEWIEDHEPAWERVTELVKRTGLTRVPVVKRGGDLDDDVQGLLNAKRYLAAVARARTGGAPAGEMKAYFEAVTYMPASATLDRALELYRTRGVKTALCVDERGAVVGVVSMTDVARRLMIEMGETNTTHDGSAPSGMSGTAPGDSNDSGVVAISPGRWSVPGRLSVRDWGAMFGVKTDRRVTTIAGLVMDRLGRVPRLGDEVRLGNLVISVRALSGRVADRLEVRLDSEGAAGKGGGA